MERIFYRFGIHLKPGILFKSLAFYGHKAFLRQNSPAAPIFTGAHNAACFRCFIWEQKQAALHFKIL